MQIYECEYLFKYRKEMMWRKGNEENDVEEKKRNRNKIEVFIHLENN